ncbi:MAG: ABC transporter permease [Gammaproteobacteria bacterium HGW-Gammaproteobacteria-8]|nr:MAG: ABC transporter permease [Gammaproteobacteria bacterium HGW-Gammaproteobacteria-8]
MNTAIATHPWAQLIRAQCLNLVREPAYTLPTLLFPVMFYAFFGLMMVPGQASWLLCTFATFGIVAAALFSFGVGIATERAQGWLKLLRASPAPISAVMAGKAFGAMLFALMIVVLMSALAAGLGGVRLFTSQWLALAAVLVVGTIPFSLIGLSLGLWLSPNAAPAVINILFLPMVFLSGLWVPVTQFPTWLQGFAAWLPPYHLAELALHVAGVKPADVIVSVAALLGYSVLFVVLTAIGWRRLDGVRQ